MYTRRLYRLCEISNTLKCYKNIFSTSTWESFVVLINALILSTGIMSCAWAARTFIISKSARSLSYFLNKAKFNLNDLINTRLHLAYLFASNLRE